MATPVIVREKRLQGRKILLGVTGGIAAYKAALLVRLLKRSGAEVQVLMTEDAQRFITPLTLGTLSEREVLTDIFPENEEGSWTKHITLGRWADLFVIAPATAQTIARLAHGFSDSMLTVTALAARCPVLVCPAMDHDMFIHPAVQRNLGLLEELGYQLMQPEHGELASGLTGEGRMPEPEQILARIDQDLGTSENTGNDAAPTPSSKPLSGKHVLVTAGPTREPLDPVRIFTNPSTGTMGFALARAAVRLGADVTLVSGPSMLETPEGVSRVDVQTAAQMHAAVHEHADADVVIMAAAVADYTPSKKSESKLKKNGDRLTLELEPTVDILASLGKQKRDGQLLIGFALETDNGAASARSKLQRKRLDWIALNHANEPGAGFGPGTNRITLISKDGDEISLPTQSKEALALTMLQHIFVASEV